VWVYVRRKGLGNLYLGTSEALKAHLKVEWKRVRHERSEAE
jgi:hypothetical protein